MEFWGIEVKPGASVKCEPGDRNYLHLSSATLADLKKDKSSDALLSVKIDGKKLVIGILSADNAPQVSFDLVFEKEFELSHTGKAVVHVCGYKAPMDDGEPESDVDSEEESEEEMELPVNAGKPETKPAQPKPLAKVAADVKPYVPAVKLKNQVNKHEKPAADEDSDEDDSDEDDSDDVGSDEEMVGVENDSEDDDDSDDSEDDSSDDDETPKKVASAVKRPAESASKTPAGKKAKLVTPTSQKSGADGKKGGVHVATPHPNKLAVKTPATNDKSKQQTPKTSGTFTCKPCNKNFNSDGALQSHTKAKHSDK